MTQRPELPSGWTLAPHASLDSTSEEAKRLAAEGAAGRTVVWARVQTAGRGRHGRSWASPPGNLYVSILLRPDCAVRAAPQIGFVLGAAMASTIRTATGLNAVLKWPNDILVDSRKVAGILLDSAGDGQGRVAWVIAGVGVNIVHHPADVPGAGDLNSGNPAATPESLLQSFVGVLDEHIGAWEQLGFDEIRKRWSRLALASGTPLTVKLPDGTVSGGFEGIDEAGNLLVMNDGQTTCVSAGDVFPLPAA